MSVVGGNQFAGHAVPHLSSLIKRAGAHFISVRYIECHAVHSIFVPFKGVDEVACVGVPELAGSVIATSYELVTVFVEATVGEGQHMALELLDQHELLLTLFLYFTD